MYSFPYLERVYCSMSSSNCCFLTCIQVSQEAGQVVWYSHLLQNFPQIIVTHTIKGFSIVNEAKVGVFLEVSCFFDDPTDVGNLISDSSAFSKSSLNIWKFLAHVLLKLGLENFEYYFDSLWDECNCAVVWIFLALSSLGLEWKLTFSSPGNFQMCWHIECSTFTASSFRMWNRSAGIPSPPLALFVVLLPRPTWLHIPGCLALGEWSHHRDYLGCEDLLWRSFEQFFCVFLPSLVNIFCFC